jgi:hypothetical protein
LWKRGRSVELIDIERSSDLALQIVQIFESVIDGSPCLASSPASSDAVPSLFLMCVSVCGAESTRLALSWLFAARLGRAARSAAPRAHGMATQSAPAEEAAAQEPGSVSSSSSSDWAKGVGDSPLSWSELLDISARSRADSTSLAV